MTHDQSKTIEAVTRKLVGVQYRCGNCDHVVYDLNELRLIKHYSERVDVDGPFPDGECPKCGSLAYEEARR